MAEIGIESKREIENVHMLFYLSFLFHLFFILLYSMIYFFPYYIFHIYYYNAGKGYVSRNIALRERQNELMFIGMKPRKDNYDLYEKNVSIAYIKRKQQQLENKEGYEKALEDLKDVIIDEEGPEKREQFREDRTLWITDQIAQEKFPTDLDTFYESKLPNIIENGDMTATIEKSEKKNDKKSEKKNDKKNDSKGSKDEKNKNGKKGGTKEIEIEVDAMPKLQGKTIVRFVYVILSLLFMSFLSQFYLNFYFIRFFY